MNSSKGFNVDFDIIKQLIATLETSKLNRLVVKKGDFEIELEKGGHAAPPQPVHRVEAAPAPAAVEAPRVVEGSFVKSPMVGTFYASPSPDQPHFVKTGDRVDAGTVVCIIEAMKVMNEVKAGVSGTVAEILSSNGQPVEFGSRLFRIT